jgi:SAM-dependent methyltransferase
VIDGVALLLEDISEYISSRPALLGKWILSSKTSAMKEYLKEMSSTLTKLDNSKGNNLYEVDGPLYESYNWAQFDFGSNDRFLSLLKHKLYPNDLYNKVVHSTATNLDGAALDLGCSSGYAAFQLAKKFAFVIGVDLSFSFIREARRRMSALRQGNLDFVVADCIMPPFVPNKFDLVIALNIIEFMDVEQLLDRIHRLLKEDGEVAFTSPYDYNRRQLGTRVNPQSFRQLLQRSGFRIGSRYTTSESFLPWTLKINERTYLFYYVDYLRARKASKAKR